MFSLFMALFLLVLAQPASAGYLLSMEEAEKMFFENSLEIKAKKADVKKSDAEVVDARILPNPIATYNIQSVKNGGTEREEIYSLGQRIDISGKQSKKIASAMKKRDARALFVEHDTAGLLSQMKQAYYRILLIRENKKAMEGILGMFAEVESKTDARLRVGDVSEADLMKLVSERKRFSRTLEGLKAELTAEKRRLGLMLNLEDMNFELKDAFQYAQLPLNSRNIQATALELRRDVRAQEALVEAADASLSASMRETVPTIEIEGGYKKRTGGFEGFVFGIAVPLPLFDRNQGKIALSKAEAEQERLAYELKKRSAVNEVNMLSERLAYLTARIADISEQLKAAREITDISRIAYEEGENGLIEMLDAVRSERELAMEYHGAVFDYWSAVFELERATGTKLVNIGGTR
jgi:cobalt-zinc-cadmium efflux system outer membrane protein